ncbi:MAG: glycosyltransferase family 4 protein [Chloroflexota bacterium]|nr:glycosyltransferase family 4 protein [Chloroflexota bacterium]
MHVLILTPFYPPEIGAAAIRLGRLAKQIVAAGHRVTVLTCLPNYPAGVIPPAYRGRPFRRESCDGVDVRRVWVYTVPNKRARARLLNQFSFTLMAALRGTFLARPDVILVESHPLPVVFAGGWLKRVKRAPLVLNVSDLWPESAVATGALQADSAMVKIAARVEKWAYRDAAGIVGMTEGIIDGIHAVTGQSDKVKLIKNGVDLDAFRPHRADLRAEMRARYDLGDRFVVAHIGNMSLTYDFETLLTAAARAPELTFLFVGDGTRGAYVRERAAALPNVILTGTLAHDAMPGIWAAADAAIIAMRDSSLAGGTRPAKLYEAMATGTPVVAAIRGEGAALIAEAGAGVVVPIGDADAFVSTLRDLAANAARRAQYGAAGRSYAEHHFSPDAVARAYAQLMQKVT